MTEVTYRSDFTAFDQRFFSAGHTEVQVVSRIFRTFDF